MEFAYINNEGAIALKDTKGGREKSLDKRKAIYASEQDCKRGDQCTYENAFFGRSQACGKGGLR